MDNEDTKFNYMMLSRLQMDCDYFLGWGNHSIKHLWAGNVKDQIAEMFRIHNSLLIKPDWLSYKDIKRYAKQMNT